MRRPGLLGLIYLIVGIFVASNHNYLDHVDTLKEILSAIIAVLLWPLVLLGADLHLHAVVTASALTSLL